MTPNVFLSVGTTFLPEQERFVEAIEQYLRDNSLAPGAMNRTDYWATGHPLKNVTDLMKQCSGTVVIAFERKYIHDGTEKRGSPDERSIASEKVPTVWNHIEPVQAYMLGHPVLMIAERDLHPEGILEDKYEWQVQRVSVDPTVLNDRQFRGVFLDWKKQVDKRYEAEQGRDDESVSKLDPSSVTIGQLIQSLTTGQLWGIVAAICTAASAIAATAYTLGGLFAGGP